MSQRRVLLLGITGVKKRKVYDSLTSYRENIGVGEPTRYISFEDKIDRNIYNYFDDDEDGQRRTWLRAWEKTVNQIDDASEGNIVLGMHGVLTRYAYGSRSPAVIRRLVEDYRPTEIISLIHDVYLHRHRTVERAGKKDYEGKPDSVQIIEARRSSIFLGDLIHNQSSAQGFPTNHYILSAWHPAQVLDSILSERGDSSVYLAFPISTPRDEISDGNPRLKNILNEKFSDIYEYSFGRGNGVFFFSPLTIDEYPFVNCLSSVDDIDRDDTAPITFNMSNRWNVRDFYGDDTVLLNDEENTPDVINIDVSGYEARSAPGLIAADVRHRDYKLVRQSDYVGVVNPILPGMEEISGGVGNEIEHAMRNGTPVHIYQNESFDNQEIVRGKFEKGGSLGVSDRSRMVVVYNDLDRWLQSFE